MVIQLAATLLSKTPINTGLLVELKIDTCTFLFFFKKHCIYGYMCFNSQKKKHSTCIYVMKISMSIKIQCIARLAGRQVHVLSRTHICLTVHACLHACRDRKQNKKEPAAKELRKGTYTMSRRRAARPASSSRRAAADPIQRWPPPPPTRHQTSVLANARGDGVLDRSSCARGLPPASYEAALFIHVVYLWQAGRWMACWWWPVWVK